MTNEEALMLLNDMEFADKYQGRQEYAGMLIFCKSALEKQIPKKPIYDKLIYGEYWYCPNCNEVVLAKLKDSPIENEYNHSHCGGCGQALDWNE